MVVLRSHSSLKDSDNTFPLLEQYMNYMLAVQQRSELTMKEYRYDLIMFFRFIKREKDRRYSDLPFKQVPISDVDEQFIQNVTTDDLFVFLIYLSRERKASATTRARKVATLKSFFKYLYKKRKLLSVDPSYELESPKIGKRLPKYLNLDESQSLLRTAHQSGHTYAARDFCILTLFLNCGMRLSELRGINLSDIHEHTLTVIGKGDKERTIYLNAACMHAIDEYLKVRPTAVKNDFDALFISRIGRRLSHQMIQIIVKNMLARAGIDTRVYSVHKLRHTAATLMYKHGRVDIRSLQTILGHSSVATTQIYTHVDDDTLHEAVERNPLSSFTPDTPAE